MNKKTIITALLALVAISLVSIIVKGQEKSVNSIEVKSKIVDSRGDRHLSHGSRYT